MDDDKDPKVKELLTGQQQLDEVVDEATRKELERWFGLPSAEAQELEPPKPKDLELEEAKKRRAWAIEAVDLALLARIEARIADRSDELIQFKPDLDVHVDPETAFFDQAMLAKIAVVGDAREVERPDDLQDELKSVAPQALLRDLHRPVTDFSIEFEHVDMAAEQRMDIVEEVKKAMRTSWKLPRLGKLPFVEARELLAAARAVRKESWPLLYKKLALTNRRTEVE